MGKKHKKKHRQRGAYTGDIAMEIASAMHEYLRREP